jgi:hypothetical protein
MSHVGAALLTLAVGLVAGVAHAKDCVGLSKILHDQPPSVLANATQTFMAMFAKDELSSDNCASLVSVADKIINRKRTGGRKLEGDKPLNVAEAQANLDKALRDPAIRTRVEKLQQQLSDENTRLILEAAIMDEEGYYSARDLLIQQVMQRAK